MKSFFSYLAVFIISMAGLTSVAEARKKHEDPFKIRGWDNKFSDYDERLHCWRNDPKTTLDRRHHCALFGNMTGQFAEDAWMKNHDRAWFFQTNNPRICRDKCLTSPDTCKSWAWRPITASNVANKDVNCKHFGSTLLGMGLVIDYLERDTEDGWIYWDRYCGACGNAPFIV